MSNPTMTAKDKRYCTVEESIKQSFKEIKLMREGKKQKNTLDDLWKNIAKWRENG